MPGSSILGMAGRARSKLSRITIHRLLSRFRERRPGWEGFCAIFLRWARGPWPLWILCGLDLWLGRPGLALAGQPRRLSLRKMTFIGTIRSWTAWLAEW